jgi:Uma2 family endonuclease
MVAIGKKMTMQEFRNMELDDDDHSLYELIDGIVMRRASPKLPHQRVTRRITRHLENFLAEHPLGECYPAPTDICLDEYNLIIPDFSFVSKERSFIIENDEYVAGVPDLIVEIISPGSVKRDRAVKKPLYERFGVREYWLIDLPNRTVEIYAMQENAFALHAFLENEGKITSTVLTGFEMDLQDLFD